MKLTLAELLASSQEKKVLFLGREGIFTKQEIERFLKTFNISMVSEYENSIVGVIEHTMLNPVEEDISNMAYENAIPLYKLKDLEKMMSESIKEDELLMGIKLANDQARIFRLLGNEHINNVLFVSLLRMYEWDNEEEDNREDRDVIMYTLRRYIHIKPNEEDLLYSYLTLRRLATEATDPNLLLALIGFPNFEFIIRGKEKITLRETIARNTYLTIDVIQKLISLRDTKVIVALASNKAVPVEILEGFSRKNNTAIQKALACNSKINNTIFLLLLDQKQSIVELLLIWQPIDRERYKHIEEKISNITLFSLLGVNEYLDATVVEALLEKEELILLENLASNPSLNQEILEKIYNKKLSSTLIHLAKNPILSMSTLEEIYHQNIDVHEILTALAYNTNIPVTLLTLLFEKDDFEINKGLASNPSLPMELLNILKVDTRLQNYLAKNPIFIKEYEQTLDYDKKAVQF